ncbi:hypothetical protein [Escherichia coli]
MIYDVAISTLYKKFPASSFQS